VGQGNRGVEKTTKQELIDLYSSPNIIWMIKSRKMKWVDHVALMGERRGVYRVLVGTTLEDHCVNRRIILRWVFRKWDGRGRHGLD